MGQTSRRVFLGGSAALASAAMLRGAPLDAEPVMKKRELKKAVKYGMIGVPGTVMDKFKAAKEAGFDGIEMDAPSNLDKDEVLRARDATGLAIPGVVDSIHWSKTLSDADPKVREAGLEGLRAALRDCKTYGGTTVLLVPAVVNKNVTYADAYRRSQDEIRKVLPLARELGIKIAIENVWNHFLLSPVEAARYIDEFESPMIGMHFDVGNIVNYGWPEHWIAALDKRILKLDIKEFSRAKRDKEGLWKGFSVELLEGDCDWPAVMKALDAIGYKGWGCLEVPGGDLARLKFLSERLDRIYAS